MLQDLHAILDPPLQRVSSRMVSMDCVQNLRLTVSCGRNPTDSQRMDSSPWAVEENLKWWTDQIPHVLSPCTAGGKDGRVGGKKVFLRVYFTSYFPHLILLVINSICTSKFSLFCLYGVFSRSLSKLMKPSLIFSLLCPAGAWESEWATFMGAWHLSSVKPQQ